MSCSAVSWTVPTARSQPHERIGPTLYPPAGPGKRPALAAAAVHRSTDRADQPVLRGGRQRPVLAQRDGQPSGQPALRPFAAAVAAGYARRTAQHPGLALERQGGDQPAAAGDCIRRALHEPLPHLPGCGHAAQRAGDRPQGKPRTDDGVAGVAGAAVGGAADGGA
ncbi:hypothetical protein G6F35_015948 [Rhizopus arrhizus]|nr:hypothetical protein G6F35_015948 [Rhizopus arrhizus]